MSKKSKITSSHSTATPATQDLVAKLVSSEEFSKVSLGVIEPCKTLRGNRRVTIKLESGCYLLKVRDVSSVQECRVYTNSDNALDLIKKAIENLNYDIVIK